MLSKNAKEIISRGEIRLRVRRSGMFQFIVFKVRRVPIGKEQFVELFVDRVIDAGELKRLANEIGLPVEAEKVRAFPDGTGAVDFIGL